MEVKICGIRRDVDVEYINETLPDYAGFIMAKSKRNVNNVDLERLLVRLDKRVIPVCVFVNQEIDYLVDVAKTVDLLCGKAIVQLHGDEDFEYAYALKKMLESEGIPGIKIWKAVRISKGYVTPDLNSDMFNVCDKILIDTKSDAAYGGTGELIDIKAAGEIIKKYQRSIIMAGGLSAQNISSVCDKVNPVCVDVSSGVETNGFKDKSKIIKFMSEVGRYKEIADVKRSHKTIEGKL